MRSKTCFYRLPSSQRLENILYLYKISGESVPLHHGNKGDSKVIKFATQVLGDVNNIDSPLQFS